MSTSGPNTKFVPELDNIVMHNKIVVDSPHVHIHLLVQLENYPIATETKYIYTT